MTQYDAGTVRGTASLARCSLMPMKTRKPIALRDDVPKALVTSSDSFLMRICKALQEPPRRLAFSLGVDFAEIAPLLDAKHKIAELDEDYVWWLIEAYVARRVGELTAIQIEMKKQLARERKRQVTRLAKTRQIVER